MSDFFPTAVPFYPCIIQTKFWCCILAQRKLERISCDVKSSVHTCIFYGKITGIQAYGNVISFFRIAIHTGRPFLLQKDIIEYIRILEFD